MYQYEFMVILIFEIDECQVVFMFDKFLKVIINDGGLIDNVDIWGKCCLVYEIQKKIEGIYVVVNFIVISEVMQEFDCQFKLNEQIMCIKVFCLEEVQVMVVLEVKCIEEKVVCKVVKVVKV